MVTQLTESTLLEVRNGWSYPWSANELTLNRTEPPEVQGSWITFAGGGRFRRPTSYGKAELSISRGAPAIMRGHAYGKPYTYDTGPGGRLGNYSSWNWRGCLASSASVNDYRNPPTFDSMETNESVTKSLNKLADQKANIAENLATFGLTARLLVSPIQAMVSLTERLKRDRALFKLARFSFRELVQGKVSKRVAEQYLAYVYGVKPLMQDTYSLLDYMKEVSDMGLLLNSRGSAQRTYEPSTIHFNNVSWAQDEAWTPRIQSKTRTTLWAKLSDDYAGTRTLNQLGLLNPASLVWELVPYSFLIDWFLPIGPVLQALTAPAGLDFVGGSTSRRVTASGEYQTMPFPHWSVTLTNRQVASGTIRYEGYNRQALATWPRPGLWYDRDPLRLKSDGSDRIFKALALSVARMPYL